MKKSKNSCLPSPKPSNLFFVALPLSLLSHIDLQTNNQSCVMPSSSRKERLKHRDEREYQERESRSGFSIFHLCSPSIIRRHYRYQWALRPPISRPKLRHPTILEVSTTCCRLPVRIYDLWFMELRAPLAKGLKVGKSIDVGHPQVIAMLMWVRQD